MNNLLYLFAKLKETVELLLEEAAKKSDTVRIQRKDLEYLIKHRQRVWCHCDHCRDHWGRFDQITPFMRREFGE